MLLVGAAIAGCGMTPTSSTSGSRPAGITAVPTPKPSGVAGVDPCALITAAQLRQIYAATLSEGLPNLQRRGECDFGGAGNDGVSVAVEPTAYAADTFETYLRDQQRTIERSLPGATIQPVPGLGDAAASLAVKGQRGGAASVYVLSHGAVIVISCSFLANTDPAALVAPTVQAARAALPRLATALAG